MKKGRKAPTKRVLPLLSIAVALVYAIVFTALLIPIVLHPISDLSIDIIFLSLLVITATVSAAVAIVFYRFFEGEL